MSVSWTKEQQQVIDLKDCNILVSAAAGSGKTAVLVERIITQLTRNTNPLSVDRLLVMTYTEAAAAEMKGRIREAIEAVLKDYPDNVHMQQQASLIHQAKIMTIHSFCLLVIREHFHSIGLDPGFRTAEEGELKLLRQDILDQLLEERYQAADEAFLEFVESFATGRDDRKLSEIILKLYDFSLSYPSPDNWFRDCIAAYESEEETTFWQSPFIEMAEQNISRYLADALGLLEDGIKVCEQPDGPYMYTEALEFDRHEVQKVLAAGSFREMALAAQQMMKKRLAAKKKDVSEEKADQVKALRKEALAIVDELKGLYFYEDSAILRADMLACRSVAAVLVGLVQDFGKAFSEKKRSLNIVDFSDMEHLALAILTQEQEGQLVPSAVAEEYQELFAEIMIDEYQDSNLIQEALLTSVSGIRQVRYNIFMVGDVKQSIYRFRLARPELFLEKFHTYRQDEGEKRRIDLHKNFRSRREVLDSTNFFFEQLMGEDLGGICYDDSARLRVGAAYSQKAGNETEVVFLHTDHFTESAEAEGGDGIRELEARAAAMRIKELVRSQQVVDAKTGEYRLARYSDIVILTRSLKGWANVYFEILNQEGIPAHTGSREGYFGTLEIRVLLDYLRILDNFRQDIPLAAVLKSPFVRLSDRDLAMLRASYLEQPFHEAVQRYAAEGEDKDLRSRLQIFMEQLAQFREMLPYTAVNELLWRILEDTGYGDYMKALPGGEQRGANLEMLLIKAISYEETSYKGLFHFIRYIEQLQKYEIDYGEASITDEQANIVRIMSIHKSKGLEFPIVIVAGMGKGFNTQDITDRIVIHPQLGIGMDAIDLTKRTKSPTLLKKVIQKELALENLGEELRVLYVALTRAKEKLILIGTVKKWEERENQFARLKSRKFQVLPFAVRTKAGSYYDWIVPALARLTEEIPLKVVHLQPEDVTVAKAAEVITDEMTKEMLLTWDAEKVRQPEFRSQIEEQFAYVYPYQEEQQQKLKYTVSELKRLGGLPEEAGELMYEEPEIVPLIPKFLKEEEGLSGAARGSAYHKLLELLDFSVDYNDESLARAIARFAQEGKLSAEMVQCISRADILQFLGADIARRMQMAARSGQLKKEQPFVLGVDDKYLVQGIIDVYLEEDGELVVVDYKTDKVRKTSELGDKYHMQLEYYARALSQILEKPVKQKIIYAFATGEEMEI